MFTLIAVLLAPRIVDRQAPCRNDMGRRPADLDVLERRRSARDNRRGFVPPAKFRQFDSRVMEGSRIIRPASRGGKIRVDGVLGVVSGEGKMTVVSLNHPERKQGWWAALESKRPAEDHVGERG